MRASAIAGIAAVLVLAGCVAQPGPAGGDDGAASPGAARAAGFTFGPPTTALSGCGNNCFEPTIAVDLGGRIFVAGAWDGFSVSKDGGATFAAATLPPLPGGAPADAVRRDSLVQAGPDGSLYFSALVLPALTVQVARSDNAAATWPVNGLVAAAADRQWLGFGPEGTVYLTYNQLPSGVHVLRSDDRGASWTPPTAIATAVDRGAVGSAGPAVVDYDGRVHVPLTLSRQELPTLSTIPEVGVAFSDDRGASWELRTAVETPAGSSLPILALDPSGGMHLAFATEGTVIVMNSQDRGRTWIGPETWKEGTVWVPWFAATTDALVGAYFVRGQSAATLELATRPLADQGGGPAERVALADVPGPNTDFAHFAVGPDGRVHAVWSDRDSGAALVATQRAS